MDETRETATLSQKLIDSWERRTREANEWNRRLENGEIQPSFWARAMWTYEALVPRKGNSGNVLQRRRAIKAKWFAETGKKKPSLSWSLNDTFGMHFWLGGMFKVFGDTSQLMSPLIVKVRVTAISIIACRSYVLVTPDLSLSSTTAKRLLLRKQAMGPSPA